MRVAQLSLIIFVLLSVACKAEISSAGKSAPGASNSKSRPIGDQNALRAQISSVLGSSVGGVRVDYLGHCDSSENGQIVFPKISLDAPIKSESNLDTIRSVFRNDKNVSIYKDFNVIYITVGRPPREMLDVKLQDLTLDPLDQYNPNLALWRITDNGAVVKERERLGMVQDEERLRSSLVVEPSPNLPHLPKSLDNSTLGQAMSVVATTFEGVSWYGACQSPKKFAIYFDKLERR